MFDELFIKEINHYSCSDHCSHHLGPYGMEQCVASRNPIYDYPDSTQYISRRVCGNRRSSNIALLSQALFWWDWCVIEALYRPRNAIICCYTGRQDVVNKIFPVGKLWVRKIQHIKKQCCQKIGNKKYNCRTWEQQYPARSARHLHFATG